MGEIKNNHKEDKDIKEAPVIQLKESEYNELKETAARFQDAQDKLLRTQADFENMRKRLDREKQDFLKYANEGLILELLNVLDDLERVISLAEEKQEELDAFLKGVEMILAHIYELLKTHGVKPVEAEGKIFDPHYHEALMQVENKDLPENTIVEVLQKGYLMYERVIRTAKVKVSKK
ncbi:MAG: nucleotide exchange factor GrpE [Candidatus Omnitrophica bacterium]|jgi:molecular chaperone GrpE|nr:nucleotide exchange factor GrpE [Candidatus Omnitrophota bacterium]MDD5252952.1 nucleotide exchange factor GrpE [Candidatus Omnitrophota bacterium]